MIKSKKLKINVSEEIGKVSALLILPEEAQFILVLSHGAAAGMEHSFMEMLAQRLAAHGVGTLRFNFAYKEKGSGPPDRPKKAHPVILAAIEKALKYANGRTILAGGKSFGGRMTSQLAAGGQLGPVKGIVYYGYPLHAPGKPGIERAAHLADIDIPQLFLQGTRDTLASLDLIKKVCANLEKGLLVEIEGGDHSFKRLKRSEKTHEEAVEQLAIETARFASGL